MKLKKLLIPVAVLLFAVTGFSSCSDDDELEKIENENSVDESVDELGRLQNALVKIDENGNIVERILGVPLDAAVPDEVSVGVDTYDEALGIFHTLFADTTKISEEGRYAEFSTQKGSARLSKGSGEDGLVAVADFDVEGLKHVSKINFILNSSWPENANEKGFHTLGTQYEYKGAWTDKDRDKVYTFVCIRAYNNGNPALLVAINPNKNWLRWYKGVNNGFGHNMPDRKMTDEIQKILKSNWDFYEKAFTLVDEKTKEETKLLNKGEQYWIRSGKSYPPFADYLDAVNLETGDIERFDVLYKTPEKRNLFFIESALKK